MAVEPDYRLYVILDPQIAGDRPLVGIAEAAISGGATMLQLRAKSLSTRSQIELVRELLALARPHGVPLIVNDRADVALAAGADGVHLGEDDLPLPVARQILGPSAILGFSAGRPELVSEAACSGANYLGVGDVFGTASKPDADAPIGLAGLAAVVAASPLPVVAIGGVTAANAAAAIEAGAVGVAVIGAVAKASDVLAATRSLRLAVDRALQARASAGPAERR